MPALALCHKQGADGGTDATHLLLVVAKKVALAGYVTFDGLRLRGHGQLCHDDTPGRDAKHA